MDHASTWLLIYIKETPSPLGESFVSLSVLFPLTLESNSEEFILQHLSLTTRLVTHSTAEAWLGVGRMCPLERLTLYILNIGVMETRGLLVWYVLFIRRFIEARVRTCPVWTLIQLMELWGQQDKLSPSDVCLSSCPSGLFCTHKVLCQAKLACEGQLIPGLCPASTHPLWYRARDWVVLTYHYLDQM